MEERRRERPGQLSRSKSKKTCSFSIDEILKDDTVSGDEADLAKYPLIQCCRSPFAEETEKTCKIKSPKSTSPCESCSAISAFSAYRHPVCPVPTTPILHTDPYHDIYNQRAFSRYLGLTSSSHRTYDVGYSRGTRLFDCHHGTLRLFHDSDTMTSVGYPSKGLAISEDRNDAKRKGGQVRFSHLQSVELERIFSIQKYISPQERKQLSNFLQLSERQVKTWFQNRRAKWRRIKMEAEMRRRMSNEKAGRQSYTPLDEKPREISSLNHPFGEKHIEQEYS